jgi:acylphosphatase
MRLGREYRVTGRVQGVGFRFFVERAASREGLHGWARNDPDGGVTISAEGDAEALDRFEWAVRQGPPRSRIDAVDVSDVGASGRHVGFRVI